jgi:hypothetical protein
MASPGVVTSLAPESRDSGGIPAWDIDDAIYQMVCGLASFNHPLNWRAMITRSGQQMQPKSARKEQFCTQIAAPWRFPIRHCKIPHRTTRAAVPVAELGGAPLQSVRIASVSARETSLRSLKVFRPTPSGHRDGDGAQTCRPMRCERSANRGRETLRPSRLLRSTLVSAQTPRRS